MLSYFHAILLGIVEGVTEFLPVSSTGHLILASQLLGVAQSDFQKSFEILIQLGAILAVVVLYWRRFLDLELLKRLIVAFIPTGIIGFALYKVIKSYLIGNDAVVLWALFLGGIALILFERWHKEEESALAELRTLPYGKAAMIGIFQSVAVIPGVSRSAATIIGGLMLGLRRAAIVEFSFLLAVPTMLAATGLDLLKSSSSFTGSEVGVLLVGFVVSFLVAMAAVKWFLAYIRSHSFTSFGIYRVVISVLFWFFVI